MSSVSVSNYPANKTRKVEAEAEVFFWFWLNFDNKYVDTLDDQLKQQCPSGKIEGITTRHEWYWYAIAYKMKIISRGYCV